MMGDPPLTAPPPTHEQFASRWGFLLAATGSAVGLGNIWRFPFIAGENGGGAFVLLYLFFVAVLGVPMVMAMIVIGRRGRASPVNSTRALALAEGRGANWKYLGVLTVVTAFLALTFFSVVAGWTLDYIVKSAGGAFIGISPEASAQMFGRLKGSAVEMAAWHGLFMAMTLAIVARGVRGGVEKAVKLMMPALMVILLVLVVDGAATADFTGALHFMFAPDFARIDSQVVLLAVGQAFVSLSIGGGGIIVFGAYMDRRASIARAAGFIALADTLVAVLAGLAIFPLVLTYDLQAGSGPGLIFETLPIAFGRMPGGHLFGTLFLVLVFFAALTSSISMLEAVVSWLVERFGRGRAVMAAVAGGLVWVIGLASVLSFNVWSDFTPLDGFAAFEGYTLFRLLDYLTINIAIPTSALLIAVFVGWVMSDHATRDELAMSSPLAYRAWKLNMRLAAPAAIAIIFALSFRG